ncbi:MAG: polysaccharide biosynthesis C-terminal domain-containing protein [Saprospiraceae bacterium]|nr:polysaccharide biosynthesis C-terminal domain-containing protein [Saprospiraceae bacterium]
MGIIIRQSIKTTLVNFVGAVVGMVSILFIYPLNEEAVGYVQFLYSTAMFISPLIAIGLTSAAIKYYTPDSGSKEKRSTGLLAFLLTGVLVGFALFCTVFFVFNDSVYILFDKIQLNSKVFSENESTIIFLSFILVIAGVLTNYISNSGRIVIPSLLQNLGFKIYLPLLILLLYFGYLNFTFLPFALFIFYVAVVVVLFGYLKYLGDFDTGFNKSWFKKERFKPVMTYSLFNGLTAIGSLLAYRIDIIMITGMLDYSNAGLYFMVMTMAAVLDIPSHALNNISGPVIAKSWLNNDVIHIISIYKKSSVNLLIAGLYLFMGIYFCFNDLAAISSKPEVFKGGIYIFVFLAGTKLLDMLTSVNNPIINYSEKYKVNLFFVLILGVLNVFLNLYLIQKYQVVGAAISTFISMTLFNFTKLGYIYQSFRMHPFSNKLWHLLLIFFIVFIIINAIPFPSNPFFAIILKAVTVTTIFVLPVYIFKVSEDFNNLILGFKSRILGSKV